MLVRHAAYLVAQLGVNPEHIVVLTFTRAAARELRQRLLDQLGEAQLPRVATLHSFALRQLLRNSHRIETLPQPLRIADDWEERHIILEDLKRILNHRRIKETKELFSRLSADWESLAADDEGWKPDPAFIGARNEHRDVFGYTLRAELTYRLKRALEQVADFEIDSPIPHLLVDEYQDLNRCDLAVIRAITTKGAELFAAGDDDQSIYGFRKAHPEGIRQFPDDYPGSQDLPLEVCKRCDTAILELAEFVAQLDPRRIQKGIRPEEGRPTGEVALLRFPRQEPEAESIGALCRHLIDHEDVPPDEILVLLRVDTHRAYSSTLQAALERHGVPVALTAESGSVLDETPGRIVLALMRLVVNERDDLAWRTLLGERPGNRIGEESLLRIYERAREQRVRFTDALDSLADGTDALGRRLKNETDTVTAIIERFQHLADDDQEDDVDIPASIREMATAILRDGAETEGIATFIAEAATQSGATNMRSILTALESAGEDIEQELERGKVNILTMHRAKGLTADIVFVVAAEDEHLPGRQDEEPGLGDERRLLFVSLSRARHALFVTYCNQRLGQQSRLGRTGERRRTLTRFLQDAPIRPEDGAQFVAARAGA